MPKDISGSVGKTQLAGVSFDVFADADLSFVLSKYKNEGVATSGVPLIKRTRIIQELKSLTLKANDAEAGILKANSEGFSDITLSVTLANGAIVRAKGFIDFESWTTQDFKAAVTFIPRTDWIIFSS